jgi:spermidine/putrescine ABC transporter ATP-binding subunit
VKVAPVVELREVVKAHGTVVAVDHVSLEVERGEFFSLLGPSGSGKTTTLRLIAGFERPDHGDILIEGQSVVDRPPNLRPVNLVFQHYALFPHLTVAGNVAFGLEMRGVSRTEIRARVGAMLEMVRLADKADRLPAQLSGGEQQRVALARALVNRPAVLLLDEPFGALDPQLRQEMQVEVKAIHEQLGSTVICVTHHQGEALALSDRVAILHQGRILQVGRPQEVYERPATLFVAEFVGLANRLEGRVVAVTDRSCHIEAPGLPIIQASRPQAVDRGRTVSVVLRPERLRLARPAARNGFDNAVAALVAKATYNGHEMLYHVRVAERLSWTVRVPSSRDGEVRFLPGDPVLVCWNCGDGTVLAQG